MCVCVYASMHVKKHDYLARASVLGFPHGFSRFCERLLLNVLPQFKSSAADFVDSLICKACNICSVCTG